MTAPVNTFIHGNGNVVKILDKGRSISMHPVLVNVSSGGKESTEVLVSEFGHVIRCMGCQRDCVHEQIVRAWVMSLDDCRATLRCEPSLYDQDAVAP